MNVGDTGGDGHIVIREDEDLADYHHTIVVLTILSILLQYKEEVPGRTFASEFPHSATAMEIAVCKDQFIMFRKSSLCPI